MKNYILLFILLFLPLSIFANVTHFGAEAFTQQADHIKSFLFGPALRLAGIFGGAYGLLQSVITSDIRPLLTFGAIGLAVSLMDKFVSAVFVSALLLP